ncbi:MAG TPA: DUF1801 domain-containing protein [Planctomycetaceae bacterium]|nr:DUF1801 domain-containing protein [Planctomycetaceae bacterium]
MQSAAKTPAEYLAELPEDRRKAITKLGAMIRQAAPQVTESMNYGMLCYSLGEPVCHLASQKQYLSLYADPDVLAEYKPKLGKLNCGKSCLRFKSLDQLPLDVMVELIAECVARHQKGMAK